MQTREFVNRKQEIQELRELADRPTPQLTLLYGRRRVGKTYLLQHAWRDADRLFYFLAGNVTSEQNRQDLLRERNEWSDRRIPPEDSPNWRTTFRLLFDEAKNSPLIIILDEFQYLLGDTKQKRQEVTSQLNAVWDRDVEKRRSELTVILCGSEIGTMEGIGAGGPLYGRFAWRHRLEPFDYLDASKVMGERPPRKRCYLYGIFGGLPEYLDAIRSDETAKDAVVRTFLSTSGEIHFQLERLLEQEHGLREPRKYRAVLEAVASGCTQTNEIRQRAFKDISAHSVRNILDTLENLGFVRRTRNFRAGPRAAFDNRIADHAVRFWYQFVHPNRSQLQQGDAERVWQQRIEPELDRYMGKVFEQIVEEAYRRCHDKWELPAASEWGRWEGTDQDRRSIEIDIAAELDDRNLLTGEVKWSSSPVDLDLHFEHREKLRALANSGKGWAHDALDQEHSHGHLYVSAAGFTNAFTSRAKENERLHLKSLEDLYEQGRE